MKSRHLIEKEYLLKIKELKKHNKLYYDNSSTIIPDSEYDKLKKEIIKLENNFNYLKSKESPSLSIGSKPSKNFLKSKHRVKMLSLSNAFDLNDLINFEKKISNYLNLNNYNSIEYSVEPKIDGISASLTYKNKKFILGLSRGDGTEGEIITDNLKTIKDIPIFINKKNFPNDIDIRGCGQCKYGLMEPTRWWCSACIDDNDYSQFVEQQWYYERVLAKTISENEDNPEKIYEVARNYHKAERDFVSKVRSSNYKLSIDQLNEDERFKR